MSFTGVPQTSSYSLKPKVSIGIQTLPCSQVFAIHSKVIWSTKDDVSDQSKRGMHPQCDSEVSSSDWQRLVMESPYNDSEVDSEAYAILTSKVVNQNDDQKLKNLTHKLSLENNVKTNQEKHRNIYFQNPDLAESRKDIRSKTSSEISADEKVHKETFYKLSDSCVGASNTSTKDDDKLEDICIIGHCLIPEEEGAVEPLKLPNIETSPRASYVNFTMWNSPQESVVIDSHLTGTRHAFSGSSYFLTGGGETMNKLASSTPRGVSKNDFGSDSSTPREGTNKSVSKQVKNQVYKNSIFSSALVNEECLGFPCLSQKGGTYIDPASLSYKDILNCDRISTLRKGISFNSTQYNNGKKGNGRAIIPQSKPDSVLKAGPDEGEWSADSRTCLFRSYNVDHCNIIPADYFSQESKDRPTSYVHCSRETPTKKSKLHFESTPAAPARSPAPSIASGMGGGRMNRPKTAAAVLSGSPRSDCDRVMQVEHEPTRRHNLEIHTPVKRSASSTKQAPPWKKHADPPLVPFVVGPGYILSRSKSKFAVTLRDEFFDPPNEEGQQRRRIENEKDNLLKQLQQQISDLTLYLEEERLNHRQTKQRADETLRDKIEELLNQHTEHVKELQEDFDEELEKQRTQLTNEHNQYQITTEAQITKMKKEIEFLQGAFESYKSSLHQETSEKWNKKQTDLQLEMEQQKMAALHELKTKWIQEKNVEKIAAGKEHQKAIESLRKEHKKELDALVRRFSNVAADLERLKLTSEELKETQIELEAVQEAYDSTCQQLANMTRDLADSKVKLMAYEEQFEEKVGEVDAKYKKKINDLMAQNIELRRLYGQKVGELYEEKVSTEMSRMERITTAKEVMQSMIKSKHGNKAGPGGKSKADRDEEEAPDRPGSAPVTRQETEIAEHFASSIEDMLIKAKDEIIPDVNPEDILPEDTEEVEKMRKLIMDDIKNKEDEVENETDDNEEEEEEEEADSSENEEESS